MPPSRKYSDPDAIARISDLTLRSRRLVEGAISGMHRSPFHGFNIEFAEYREYTPGDDLRRLDWRVFARSDRHYIKQYEEESNVRVTFVLDASASMNYRGRAALSKFDYAATLVVALSMLLTRQQDPVGLVLFDEAATTVLPPERDPGAGRGDRRLARAMHAGAQDRTRRDARLGHRPVAATQPAGDRLGPVHRPGCRLRRAQPLAVPRPRGPDDAGARPRRVGAARSTARRSSATSRATRSCSPSRGRSGGRTRRRWTSSSRACASECGNRGYDHVRFLTDEPLGASLSLFLHTREEAGRAARQET